MTTDEALHDFQQAWHQGMAPKADAYLAMTNPAERDELEQAIGRWLATEAPTVTPHPARIAELQTDPLVQRLAALEQQRWARAEHGDAAQPTTQGLPRGTTTPRDDHNRHPPPRLKRRGRRSF